MVKIITDTSALFTVEEGLRMGIHVLPLSLRIAGQDFRDLCFDSSIFYDLIAQGNVPTSSQPPLGEVMEAYVSAKGEEVINICMADGLSGTYETALGAREHAINKDDIYVLNSQTLCGPHRYLVEKAVALKAAGEHAQQIIAHLQESIDHCGSFLIPQDFSFLKRGGRLKPAAATLGGVLKLKPVMEQVDNGRRLDKFAITRTLSSAIAGIIENFKQKGVDHNYRIYISHSRAQDAAEKILEKMKSVFHDSEFEMLELSPAFITQGGPNCIAIQYIKK